MRKMSRKHRIDNRRKAGCPKTMPIVEAQSPALSHDDWLRLVDEHQACACRPLHETVTVPKPASKASPARVTTPEKGPRTERPSTVKCPARAEQSTRELHARPTNRTATKVPTAKPRQRPDGAFEIVPQPAARPLTGPVRRSAPESETTALPVFVTAVPSAIPEIPPFVASLRGVAAERDRNPNPEPDETDDDAELTYGEWLQDHLRGSKAVTGFVTFYVHWLLVLALAAVAIHDPPEVLSVFLDAAFSAPMDDASPVEIAPLEIAEIEFPDEPMTQDAVEELLSDMSFQQTAGMENLLAEYASEQAKMSASTATDGEPGDPAASARATEGDGINPAPPHAVSAGSFSVWTEPANPDPGEPYRVIIQVRVPPGVAEYDVMDLEGFVVGSDGYRKPVPGFWRGHLPVEHGFARFVVPIVSADARVHDTVLIRSRMLKEVQKLVIEF